MATKQWIGIEEAATKYQVSTRRIITWCERQEIIYSEVGDYLMLDENSLTDCLERNIRFSLSEEEHKRRMDEKMKENEGFFVKFGGNLFFISTVFFFLNPIKSCRYVCFLVTLKTPHH